LAAVAEAYGFQPIETPMFEKVELFLARSGPEIKSSMLTFHCDHEEFALRPEMTAPVCRLAASGLLENQPPPYKLYYVAPCFRYCRPQSGRYREFTQAGIEHLGQTGAAADAEIIAAACQMLRRLGIADFRLKVGNIGIFGGLLSADLDAEDRAIVLGHLDRLISIHEQCRLLKRNPDASLIDDLRIERMELAAMQAESDYTGPHAIADQQDAPPSDWPGLLPQEAEATFRRVWQVQDLVTEPAAELLIQVSRLRGPLQAVHQQAESLLRGTVATNALTELLAVCRQAQLYDLGDFEVVLGIARGFTFYTSTVFEISSPDNNGRKYCGGGRYDRLVEEFGGPPLPATGCAFRFDTLVEDFLAKNRWSAPRPYQLYLLAETEASYAAAIPLAEALRRAGLRVGVGVAAPGSSLTLSAVECEKRGSDWLALLPANATAAGLRLSNGSIERTVAAEVEALAKVISGE
jgi:histidyl-tRNA synthetase